MAAPAKEETLVHSSYRIDRNSDKGEVGGSAPPSIYAAILIIPGCLTLKQKTICKKCAKNPGKPIWAQSGRSAAPLTAPSSKRSSNVVGPA